MADGSEFPHVDAELRAMFTKMNEERQQAMEKHRELMNSDAFKAQTTRLERVVLDLTSTLRACWFVSTRSSQFVENCFFLRQVDDLIQSALMVRFGVGEGYLSPGRRELRFMLELAVQALYVDEVMTSATFEEKREFFNRKVKHSSVDHVKELALGLVPALKGQFVREVVSAWSRASNWVHPSKQQLSEKLRLEQQGGKLGFESVEQIESIVDEVATVMGVVIVLAFHAVGPSFTADLLVDGLDQEDRWFFHRNKYVSEVDAFFDYKSERKDKVAELQARRQQRLSEALG